MPQHILIVDDESEAREELAQYLGGKGYSCRMASDAESALKAMHRSPELAIVITDIKMPGQDGLDLVSTVMSEVDRDVEFIIMTGYDDTQNELRSLRLGARDFLNKPIDLKHLLRVVEETDQLFSTRRSERLYREGLAAEVETKTVELRSRSVNLEAAFEQVLIVLAVVAEYRDHATDHHARRVAAYTRLVAAELGWSEKRRRAIELAAPLYDIGKAGIADAILLKPGALTPDEVATMQAHAETGYRILARHEHPVMQTAADIAWSHHERWDGSGYPRGPFGNEIPIEARIVSIADTYDALRSKRPYKPAYSHEESLARILDGDDRTQPDHFDPKLLEIFRVKAGAFADIFAGLSDPYREA